MERDIFTEALHKSQSSAPNIVNQVGFDETAEVLEKGRRASIGEIRDWKGQKMQKTTDGWKPVRVQTKFDLEKVEVQSVKDGSVTESELDAMPNGTEIYFDNMRFQKVDGLGTGWLANYVKDPRGYQSQTTSRHIAYGIARMSHDGTWEKNFDKVLMPKKDAKISDIKVGDELGIAGLGKFKVVEADNNLITMDEIGGNGQKGIKLSKEMFDKLGFKAVK